MITRSFKAKFSILPILKFLDSTPPPPQQQKSMLLLIQNEITEHQTTTNLSIFRHVERNSSPFGIKLFMDHLLANSVEEYICICLFIHSYNLPSYVILLNPLHHPCWTEFYHLLQIFPYRQFWSWLTLPTPKWKVYFRGISYTVKFNPLAKPNVGGYTEYTE